MSKFVATMAVVAMLFVASPAVAGVSDAVNGANGILTAPLDVAYGLVTPSTVVDFGALSSRLAFVNIVTDRIGGVAVGVYTAARRAVLGAVDVATFPVTSQVTGPFSPALRFSVVDAVAAE
jgi:hypothetical protein